MEGRPVILAALLVAAAAGSPTETITIACPDGYIFIHNACYLVSSLVLEGKDAEFFCRNMKGETAVIETQEEMDALKDHLLNSTVHLGINIRKYRETLFEFLLKMSGHNGYTNFHAGEPGNSGAEDCVVADAANGFEWRDVRCTESYQVLCKARAEVRAAVAACAGDAQLFEGRSCFWADTATTRSWTEAYQECEARGMTLASVHSDEENAFINDLVVGAHTYIGLVDAVEEGVYWWSDGTPVDYEHWDVEDGDPDGGEGSNCVAMVNGKWRDRPCTELYSFICKGPTLLV